VSVASVSLLGPDLVTRTLTAALDGLSIRQNVIANNIANVDTPDFRATSVDFESSLAAALADGDPEDTVISSTPTQTPVGANGNNVDQRKETMAAMQTVYQYQVLTRATSDRFDLLKTASADF